MKLNDTTINILKNYATINPNIVIDKGTDIKTISVARNVLSTSVVSEPFPLKFGIYDLNEFLNVISLVDEPRLKFENDYVVIGDATGRSSVKYFFSDPEMLTTPANSINMPEPEVKFILDSDTLKKVKRAAAALGHDEVAITPDSGSIKLSVVDSKDDTSNAYAISVEGEFPENVNFRFIMNVGNMKVVGEDYDVGISSKLISKFSSKQSSTEYYIALEKTSTYGEA
ncbi:hypothetical protein PQZ07_00580 [bacterium]|nr:hypothetical protein [bacterium]